MDIFSYFFPKTIARFTSKYNGEILVKESFGRKYIEVDRLMQSGRIPENLFRRGFARLGIHKLPIKKVLVLGLGGGSVIKIAGELFPHAQVVAIEIDPQMVEVARTYFDLDEVKNLRVVIGDVFDKKLRFGTGYDLIVVDLFRGYETPEKLSDENFLKKLTSTAVIGGHIIFNRLYFHKYRAGSDEFIDRVTHIFKDVTLVKDYFNILIAVKI